MNIAALLLSLFSSPSFAAAPNPLPELTIQVGEDATSKMRGWLVQLLPPAGHHFNVQAPLKVTGSSIDFIRVGATESKVGFRSSDPKLKEGSDVQASLFLCDDAKTYCVKKMQTFALKKNSDLSRLEFSPAPKKDERKKTTPGKKKVSQKDEHGFWDNDWDAALADSVATHRPILIDFYGIWCPPCNFYNEMVFPKAAFKKAAKNWVLLKMDADAESSFELKSRFKIGGYPTLLALKAPSEKVQVAQLTEINRIIGYFPLTEFNQKLASLYQERNQSLEERLQAQKVAMTDTLKALIASKLDQKQNEEVITLAEQGERLAPNDAFFSLILLKLRSEHDPALLKVESSATFLRSFLAQRDIQSSQSLVAAVDLLITRASELSHDQVSSAQELIDTLSHRVDPKTLSVSGVELSIADIESLKIDLADALHDENLKKKLYADAIQAYQKVIALEHGQESRGLNLELAYLYSKNNQLEEAKKIYSRFIARYPKEFTFYFSAARMYLELKDYPHARENAEKAVEYAYGDNQLRAMERLIRVMSAQGEKTQAVKLGQEYLAKKSGLSHDPNLRTQRYVNALQKALDEAGRT